MPPRWPEPSPALRADYATCRAVLRVGSRSFHAASLLLPRSVRLPASALYAFCRVADDAVDLGADKASALGRLARRLEAAYAGRPEPTAIDRAFAQVVATCDVPRALPEALLEGLAWDTEGRTYGTLGDLEAYAARVGASVGAMMTLLMGERDADMMARACDLGVAMQYTNIARDVGEDARAGRLYLPRDWMEEAGLDPSAFLADPVFDARVAGVVRRLLAEATRLYDRALSGIERLPADCQPAIHAARLIYAEIGADIARHGHDSVARRAVIGPGRKLALVGRSMLAAPRGAATLAEPPLPGVAFLIEAVARHRPRARAPALGLFAWERVGRVIDVFEKLETQNRSLFGAPQQRQRTR